MTKDSDRTLYSKDSGPYVLGRPTSEISSVAQYSGAVDDMDPNYVSIDVEVLVERHIVERYINVHVQYRNVER